MNEWKKKKTAHCPPLKPTTNEKKKKCASILAGTKLEKKKVHIYAYTK